MDKATEASVHKKLKKHGEHIHKMLSQIDYLVGKETERERKILHSIEAVELRLDILVWRLKIFLVSIVVLSVIGASFWLGATSV